MDAYLLHGIWNQDSGLHLWIEQVEGHKVVNPRTVPEGFFPQELSFLGQKRTAHRLRMTLQTPKGKRVKLPVPTLAFTPEQAVMVLDATYNYMHSANTSHQLGIADDLAWFSHCAAGLHRFVSAGRVIIKMAFQDNAWFPRWQLTSGLNERAWLGQMFAAMPGVLMVNANFSVGEEFCNEMTHWIANSQLFDRLEPRPTPWHPFVQALLGSKALPRGRASLVAALNAWRDSVNAWDVKLVIMVEEPDSIGPDTEEDIHPDEMLWPVRLRVRSGLDTPRPIHIHDYDRSVRNILQALYQEVNIISSYLSKANRIAPEWVDYDPERDGDWDVYLNTEQLSQFVSEDVKRLQARKFTVLLPRAWQTQHTKAELKLKDSVENARGAQLGFDQIVNYDWKISVGDVQLSESEMQRLVESQTGLINLRGEWVVADTRVVHQIRGYMDNLNKAALEEKKERLKDLKELLVDAPDFGAHQEQIEALEREIKALEEKKPALEGNTSLGQLRSLRLQSRDAEVIELSGTPWFEKLLGGRASLEESTPKPVALPKTVRADLRVYQQRGVDWMYWMTQHGLGAVLADDMGLGKTLQLLALEAVERQKDRSQPTLIIAPTSVVGNWKREAKKFVPSLKVLVHHGAKRTPAHRFTKAAYKVDLVITSYGTILRDFSMFQKVGWFRVVLDEAQQIKNSSTKISRAVRAIPSNHRVALTGTPVENRLAEMRSILDFCNPGILGSPTFFKNHFARPIERADDPELAEQMTQRLRRLSAPFVLRRLKTDPNIVDDLPEKSEVLLTVTMPPEQAALYSAFVEDVKLRLSGASGINKKGLVLAAITKIKQICNHPAHFLGDGSGMLYKGKHRSGKVAELMRLVDEAQQSQQRLLIFTQYRAFGTMLQEHLSEFYGSPIPFLHGGLGKQQRDNMVEAFQQAGGPPAMVLSLKAGGTGLNLTAASIVVHMDRWWNPAVENQATDRAYRIGQRRDVTVYKMITAGTMEESIQQVLDGKSELASSIITQGEGWITELSNEELDMLMSYRMEVIPEDLPSTMPLSKEGEDNATQE